MAFSVATKIQLLFAEDKPLSALDLSSLIFDINRLYVLAVKAPETQPGSVSEFRNYGRNSYRLSQELRLEIARIRFESPGLIEFATATAEGASALWLVVQALEKVTTWPLNRQKLQLEVLKLQREAGVPPPPVRRERIEPFLNFPETRSAVRQLEQNPLRASDVEVSPGSALFPD